MRGVPPPARLPASSANSWPQSPGNGVVSAPARAREARKDMFAEAAGTRVMLGLSDEEEGTGTKKRGDELAGKTGRYLGTCRGTLPRMIPTSSARQPDGDMLR